MRSAFRHSDKRFSIFSSSRFLEFLILPFLLFAISPCDAQDATPFLVFGSSQGAAPVIITGGYRLLGQLSSRQGTFQEKPPDLWRAEVNPTMIIYGIPLTANILVSSEQQGLRQNINAFSLTLDPDAIKRIVMQRAANTLEGYAKSEVGWMLDDYDNVKDSLAQYDPDKLKQLDEMRKLEEMRDLGKGNIGDYAEVLNSMGLMSDVEEVMTHLPKVGVGAVFPIFTPITLSGARIEGGFAEWNPGQVFFIAGVGGRTQRPLVRVDSVRVDTTMYTSLENSNFGRLLYGGRIGYGRPDGVRAILTGIYVVDDPTSITLPDSGVALTPQKNYNLSFDLKVEPIPGIWTIEGEFGGSMTVGDQNSPHFSTDGAPQFLLDLADSNASTYVDWAAVAATTINLRATNTRITGKFRRIGTGYRALGVPNLRTDYVRYDARIDQAFWKRQISVGLFVRQDRDNLIPIKRATSTLFSAGASLGLTFRGLPYVRLSYAPYVQESDATDTLLKYINRTVLWSVSTGYAYRIGDLMMNSNLTLSRQDAETKNNTSINATQSVTFAIPLTASIGLGYIAQTSVQTPSTKIITTDFSAGYTIADMITPSVGLTLAFDETFGTRTGYFVSVLGRLGQVADVDVRVERNIFTEIINPAVLGGSYNENIFRVTISKSW